MIDGYLSQAQEYDLQSDIAMGVALPLMYATGVGGLTYAMYKIGRKSAQPEEYDFHDDIDLQHY